MIDESVESILCSCHYQGGFMTSSSKFVQILFSAEFLVALACAAAMFFLDSIGILLVLIFVVVTTTRLVVRLIRERARITTPTLLDLCSLGLIGIVTVMMVHAQALRTRATIEFGQHLVARISSFRNKHQRYPHHLSELESARDAFPKHQIDRFHYQNFGNRYSLSFNTHFGMVCYPNQNSPEWTCD